MVEPGGILRIAAELPYIVNPPSDGRSVFVVPFFESRSKEWFFFVQRQDEALLRIAGRDVVVGSYLSSEALRPDEDLYLPLENLVFQKMSFTKLARPLMGLEDVIENLASILEFYRLVSLRSSENRIEGGQLAEALVEYLLVTARSLYDVLQVLSREAALLIKRVDDRAKSLMHQLPDSFADVALHGDRPRTREEIQDLYAMPAALAAFYAEHAGHVRMLRDVRGRVVHRGHHASYVIDLDEGLAVRTTEKPWSDLPIWNEDNTAKNDLGSLRALFAYICEEALDATTGLADAYASFLLLPDPISPANRVFLRGPLNRHLLNLEQTLRSPWERRPREGKRQGGGRVGGKPL